MIFRLDNENFQTLMFVLCEHFIGNLKGDNELFQQLLCKVNEHNFAMKV